MQKKILLIDTNFSAKPIYDYLIKTGSEVYVIGGNQNDALAKSVKNYINLDYSDIFEVKTFIEKNTIDYLVPGGNDFSYKVCSIINEELCFYNIDSVEINEIINNKEKFRKVSTELNLHVPRIVETEKIYESLPIIIKPVDAYSGHGMTVIYDTNYSSSSIDSAIRLAKKNSKSQNYLIEEFVQGQLYSHSAFIVNGEIILDFIVEEHCTVNPYVVDTSRVVFDFDKNILNQIKNDITLLAQKLKFADGLVHTQFISNGQRFWLIEITRRCPGDLYSKLIEYSTGLPYAEFYARPFLNQRMDFSNIQINKKLCIRHTISQTNENYFSSLNFKLPICIEEFIPLTVTGDRVKSSPFSRIGVMFINTSTKREWDDIFQKLLSKQLYEIQCIETN